MKYRVMLVESAEIDLYEIHLYIELNESPERADDVLDGLERTISGLDHLPERGHQPPERERSATGASGWGCSAGISPCRGSR